MSPIKLSLVIVIVLSAAVLAVTEASAVVIGGPVVHTGHTYYLLSEASWTASEAEAIGLGGHLATINAAAEDDFVFNTFGNFGGVTRELWIGLNDAASEGTFVWSSGEPVGYTNWFPGEPNSLAGEPGPENYVHILAPDNQGGRRWNDSWDGGVTFFEGPFNGVVEVPFVVAEPGTLLLLGSGLLPLIGFGRKGEFKRGKRHCV